MFKSFKTGVIAVILISSAAFAQAQKKISAGTLVYTMKNAEGDSEQTIKFNGDISKLEIAAGPATIGIFNDSKNGTGLVLVDVPVAQMQKAAKMSKADVDKQTEALGGGKLSDFKATGEKQVIATYNAEKYTYKNAAGESYEVWITKDAEIPLNMFTGEFKDVKGTIVKFTGKGGTVTLKSATEGKVDALSVTEIPKGYDEITYEELQAMQGGGQ
ncbi:hypothetical protein [Pedobacter namyangjuensis]|uniref:hypothetical protein n=1 Tax=Pedobacter namyangjuensis TaxID=600626 RepID=UPI000DE4E56D|nr:hypothetical protein [Pedobacter namyangjuensis]